MIRDLFYALGYMTRWAIVLGTVLTIIALMMLGSKVGGWVTDVQQVHRAVQLDEREAALRAEEKAALDKREADITRRERELFGHTLQEEKKVADAQADLVRIKADTARVETAARVAEAARKREAERVDLWAGRTWLTQ